MCPLCIGSALLWLGGTGSAGGVAAVAMGVVSRRRKRASRDAARLMPPSPGKLPAVSTHHVGHHDGRP
jgi:hypothetical protein